MDKSLTQKEADMIALEAYVYLYPLVTMDITRRVMTNTPAEKNTGSGPMNTFHHVRTFPSADFRNVVRPNFDTLYSIAWLDLTKEPIILSIADTGGRYYLLEMLDMWSDAFATPGTRTSGTHKQIYAIFHNDSDLKLPDEIASIQSPTPYVWIIGRTQTNGLADCEAVHKIQNGYQIKLLSQWNKESLSIESAIDSTVDIKTPPLAQVEGMNAPEYFNYGAELIKKNSIHMTDWSQLERLKRIGIIADELFDFDQSSPMIQLSLEKAMKKGVEQLTRAMKTIAPVVNGWQINTSTMGVYGNNYFKRAIVARIGLGANQPEDAIYPVSVSDVNGKPLKAGQAYALHFEKDKLPPVDAFWSITLYDHQGFQVANALNRFAIGDRDHLKYNADGSLDIFIQPNSPGIDKESNWLPAPHDGDTINLTMRLYAPRPEVLNGQWEPPVIQTDN